MKFKLTIKKKKLLIISASCLISLSIAYITFMLIAASYLDEAYRKLDKVGYPRSINDIKPKNIPNHENALPLYQAAVNLLDAAEWEDFFAAMYSESEAYDSVQDDNYDTYPPAALKQVYAFIQKTESQQCIAALRLASQKTDCQFITDYSKGPAILMPHLTWNINEFLKIAVQAAHANNDLDLAKELISMQAVFAKHLLNEPVFISHIYGCHLINHICKSIQTIASTHDVKFDQELAMFSTQSIEASMANALKGEMLLFVEWVFNPRNLSSTSLYALSGDSSTSWFAAEPLFFLYMKSPFFDLDHAKSLEFHYKLYQDSQKPYSLDHHEYDFSSYHLISNMLLPALDTVRANSLECSANVEITKAGLELIKAQRQGQVLPDHITSLDPFSLKPLIYKSTEQGFTIESLGKQLDGSNRAPKWDCRLIR